MSQGRLIHWGYVQEEEVASAAGVDLVYQTGQLVEDCREQSFVLRGVAVANVVDADEDCEQSVV